MSTTITAATKAFIRNLPKVSRDNGIQGIKSLVADMYTPAYIALTRSTPGKLRASALQAALESVAPQDKAMRKALQRFLSYLPKAGQMDPVKSIQGLAADAFGPVLNPPANPETVARAARNFKDLAGGAIGIITGSRATPL